MSLLTALLGTGASKAIEEVVAKAEESTGRKITAEQMRQAADKVKAVGAARIFFIELITFLTQLLNAKTTFPSPDFDQMRELVDLEVKKLDLMVKLKRDGVAEDNFFKLVDFFAETVYPEEEIAVWESNLSTLVKASTDVTMDGTELCDDYDLRAKNLYESLRERGRGYWVIDAIFTDDIRGLERIFGHIYEKEYKDDASVDPEITTKWLTYLKESSPDNLKALFAGFKRVMAMNVSILLNLKKLGYYTGDYTKYETIRDSFCGLANEFADGASALKAAIEQKDKQKEVVEDRE